MTTTPPLTAPIVGFVGSSRRKGDTAALAHAVFAHLDHAALIDVSALNIGPYDYGHAHRDDDFASLAEAMAAARVIVFASPVYWYSMTAQMKAVFDRLCDMTEIYKPLGKALAGKSIFAIATGSAPEAPASFTQPFADTAGYFDMSWGGVLYVRGREIDTPAAQNAARLFAGEIARHAGGRIAAPA